MDQTHPEVDPWIEHFKTRCDEFERTILSFLHHEVVVQTRWLIAAMAAVLTLFVIAVRL